MLRVSHVAQVVKDERSNGRAVGADETQRPQVKVNLRPDSGEDKRPEAFFSVDAEVGDHCQHLVCHDGSPLLAFEAFKQLDIKDRSEFSDAAFKLLHLEVGFIGPLDKRGLVQDDFSIV